MFKVTSDCWFFYSIGKLYVKSNDEYTYLWTMFVYKYCVHNFMGIATTNPRISPRIWSSVIVNQDMFTWGNRIYSEMWIDTILLRINTQILRQHCGKVFIPETLLFSSLPFPSMFLFKIQCSSPYVSKWKHGFLSRKHFTEIWMLLGYISIILLISF